ncbi:ATPase, T2SS/T4P/T4SS family [Vibrio cholerae]|uniref:ATPase, T2SS/T4P/T4SS family n=1 Tax=Vibrio cholerae TaxID=666 RepID=UPI000BA979AD|nr:ATPase, T2SS/T4P/T4SS family [Vibrio cholerae]PAR92344.1 pilus assembly protein [Vibrio cholerae]
MRIKFFDTLFDYKFVKDNGVITTRDHEGEYCVLSSDNISVVLTDSLLGHSSNAGYLILSEERYKLLDIKLAESSQLNFSEKTRSEERIANILKQAIERRSSDIHFIRESDTAKIKYRTNGKLELVQEVLSKDCDEMMFVLYNVMASTKETTWNTKNAQDANIIMMVDNEQYRFRYAHMPIFSTDSNGANYHAVVRVIYPNKNNGICSDLQSIGLRSCEAELLERILSNPSGLVIVSGVTGSGKSTSLKNYMEYIAHVKYQSNGCFLTVEDPVEYIIDGAQQSSVTRSKDTSNLFAEAVRSSMRRDPDVLMIGEIRDSKTGHALASAVESGHLCLTTVHAGNVVGVLQRLQGLGIGVDKLATPGFIVGVMNQKLIPKICPHCSIKITNDYSRESYKAGEGCLECNYKTIIGRHLVIEFLIPDFYILKQISEHKWVDIYTYLKSKRSYSQLGLGYSIKDKVYKLCLEGSVCSEYFKSSFGPMDIQDEEIIFSVHQQEK